MLQNIWCKFVDWFMRSCLGVLVLALVAIQSTAIFYVILVRTLPDTSVPGLVQIYLIGYEKLLKDFGYVFLVLL